MTEMLRGLRILLVEDEPLLAMVAEDVLERMGMVVLGPAATVDAALRLVEHGGIDVAILDVNLRGERIDPVAQALAAAQVAFLFTTGHGREALPAGQRDRAWLAKPFTEAALIKALAGVVGNGVPTTPAGADGAELTPLQPGRP